MLGGLPFAVSIAALLYAPLVATQQHASCTNSAYSWAFNSLNQSPCTIGEFLGNECAPDGDFNIQSLPAGYYYSGMNLPFATDCVCNRVYFSVLSACAACQGGYASPWSEWNVNCSVPYDSYPKSIPVGTAIPHWAYNALLANGTVNFASASSDIGPEATPTATTSNAGPTGTGSSANGGSKKKSSTPIGAIVGGVVGGIALIVLIALAVFFIRRRNNSNRKSSPPSSEKNMLTAGGFGGNDMNRQSYMPAPTSMPNSPMPEKPYDPSDPSTFPTSPGPTLYTPSVYNPGQPPYSPNTANFAPPMSPATPPTDGNAAGTYYAAPIYNPATAMRPESEYNPYNAAPPSQQPQQPPVYKGAPEV